MRRWMCLLWLVAVAPFAGVAQGQGCTPSVRSYSTAEAGPLTASGPFFGHPAITSISNGFQQTGYNVTASAALTIDESYFSTYAHVGGQINIYGTASNSGAARSTGDVYDCLVVDGYQGSGRVHVPVHVRGDTAIGYTIAGNYQGNAGSSGSFVIACDASIGGQGIACPTTPFAFSVGEVVDTTIELVFTVPFGTPFQLHYGPRLTTALGYAANGSEGILTGNANVDLTGVLEPASVDDGFGTPLPNATITASSGVDYFHPVPEPASDVAAGSASFALAALRRRTRAPARVT